MKLRNKMVLSYGLFFILPFMIIGLFVVHEYRQSALDKASEQASATVERIKMRTNESLGVAISLSNRLTLDTDLEDIVMQRYAGTSEVVEAYRGYKKFQTYLDFNPEVSRIKVFADNPTLLNNWEFFPLDADTRESFWYKSAIEQSGQIGWYYFPSVTRRSDDMLSLVRSLYFPESRSVGVIAIDVNTSYLNAVLRQEDSETVLADANGIIVASNRADTIGKTIEASHLGPDTAKLAAGAYEQVIDGHLSKVLVADWMPEKSYNGLKIISVFQVQRIVKEANAISTTGFRVIGLVSLVALLLIYVICTAMTKRLLLFNRQISKVSTGNFHSVLTVDGNDEIGQISRQFNQMVGNIRGLMDEVNRSHEQTQELERRQNEIKLKMLASQINPHFLYNALESIRMKAHLKGEREIAQVVKLLGKLMRKNLEVKGQAISVADEIDMIRCYLEIQKFRHDDRLDYDIRLEPDAGEVRILPLLIQPLVENAVIHGLENHLEGGKVRVEVVLDGEWLRVAVEDNGAGIPDDRLSEIRQSLQAQDANRIGLYNIQQRLLMTYGDASGLVIESKPRSGTRISFRIPVGG